MDDIAPEVYEAITAMILEQLRPPVVLAGEGSLFNKRTMLIVKTIPKSGLFFEDIIFLKIRYSSQQLSHDGLRSLGR